ncbi:MFS transporter [Mesorhizobium sp. M2A.F.Ca.ET.043.05.1.1]|uniref:MFS transporter n=1 Tax=Mesorhizobium sp. M2A.F.Ca.ET.043.05.1.1 TaxID=2493671 RepID=UPI001FE18F8D|nr:MFS transporter [Mesorhizobium sp. M2A.F.Ca.ET.043.05.1.1]
MIADGSRAGHRFLHDGTGGQLEQHLFATDRDPRLKLIIPAIVAIAFLMEQLDSTILTTAIPAIAQSLDTTPVRLNLAITTYILTLAVFIPVSGWFADRFGTRRSSPWRSSPSPWARFCAAWPTTSACFWPCARCRDWAGP